MAENIKKNKTYNIISRSNMLINGGYTSTLLENKLTVLALKWMKENNDGTLSVSFTTEQLRHLTGTKGNGFYVTLQKAASHMIGRTVFIENEQEHYFDYINLIERCTFQDGVFSVCFTRSAKDLIYNLKNNFTQMSLEILFSFRSNYSYRLYELLKVHEYRINSRNTTVEVEYGLSDLKLKMNCIDTNEPKVRTELAKKKPDIDKIVNELSSDKKNSRWGNFKKWVLDVAVDELNDNNKVEFYIKYDTIKSGRGGKVTGIRFTISQKEVSDIIIGDVDLKFMAKRVMDLMKEDRISEADAIALVDASKCDYDKIEQIYQLAKQQEWLSNIIGWMIKGLKDGYSDGIPNARGSRDVAETVIEIQNQYSCTIDKENAAEGMWNRLKETNSQKFQNFQMYIQRKYGSFELYETVLFPSFVDKTQEYGKFVRGELEENYFYT